MVEPEFNRLKKIIMVGRKLHDLELLLYMTVRSSFFSIQNTDEYFIYLTGYRIGKKSQKIDQFLSDFYKFLLDENPEFNFGKRDLSLVVSFLSGFKCNSLMVLRSMLIRFLQNKNAGKLKLVKDFNKKNNLENLINEYSNL